MTKAEQLARARVREQEAAIAAYDAETDKLKAAQAIAAKKIDRERQPAVYRRSDNTTIDLTDMVRVHPGYIGKEVDPRDLPAAIEAGTIKIETDGSVQRSAKTVAKSLRVMNAEDTRTLRRLDVAIAKAQSTRRALIDAAWERGTELTLTEVAKHAAKMKALLAAGSMAGARGGPNDWKRRALESDLQDALIHQRFTKGEMDAEQTDCPCLVCKRERAEAEKQAAFAAALAALPKIRLTPCRLCGKNHLAPLGRARDENREDVPATYCAKSNSSGVHWAIHRELLAKEREQQKRDEAKNLRDNGVTWVCPADGCDETVTAVPAMDPQEGELYVECPVCEWSVLLDDIKLIGRNARKYAKEAA
jgi:hypothetical protein